MSVVESIAERAWSQEGARARIFSGHESFPCRYGWLPKLYEAVEQDPEIFSSDERAILALGLGRNMVKALRFWGDVFGLLKIERGLASNTRFARRLLDVDRGLDPFLEDRSTLWRLHWRITAHGGLGAWVTAFLELQDGEIPRDRLVELVRSRAQTARGPITAGTASAHVDMLIRTYDWSRISERAGGEDASGCPFQELHLMESSVANGTSMIRLPRGRKPDLEESAFAFALHDFWTGTAPASHSLSLRALLLERRSPGQIFRLDESSLHERLDAVAAAVGMELRDDGTGGIDLVARDLNDIGELESLAWPTL